MNFVTRVTRVTRVTPASAPQRSSCVTTTSLHGRRSPDSMVRVAKHAGLGQHFAVSPGTAAAPPGGQVPIAIGLVVLLAALCASGVLMWRRLAASNVRLIGPPPGELRDL